MTLVFLVGPRPASGLGVDADGHRDRRLVDGDQRQRDRVLHVGQRLADHDVGHAGDRDDVAGAGGLAGSALETLGDQELGDLRVGRRAVALHPRDLLALLQGALLDADQGETAEERGGVEVGDVGLQRRVGVVDRRRDRVDDRLEQRLEVLGVGQPAVLRHVHAGAAGLGAGVDDREVERLGAVAVVEQVHEQLVGLVDDLADPGVGPVHLVDDQHDRHVGVERLAEHEPGLGERSLGRVDQQHDAVDHRQAALDLATEVGVAGGVDDVDRHRGAAGGRAGVLDRGVLREDRDALLALEVTGVHRPLVDVLVLAERAALPEHRVHQGGLAVVDVRDDGDVPEVGAVQGLGHEGSFRSGFRRTSYEPRDIHTNLYDVPPVYRRTRCAPNRL